MLKNFLFLISIFFILISAPLAAFSDKPSTANITKQATRDFSKLDLLKSSPLILDGQWLFFFNEIIEPNKIALIFNSPNKRLMLRKTPGLWDDRLGVNDGYATLAIKIKLPSDLPDTFNFGFLVPEINTVSKIYITANGDTQLLNSIGSIENLEEKITIPRRYRSLGKLNKVDSNEIFIVIHQWNYDFINPYISNNFLFGEYKKVRSAYLGEKIRDTILFGILIIMGLYHLALFSQRRKDIVSLTFAFLCFSMALRVVTTSRALQFFFPDIDHIFFVEHKLEYISLYLLIVCFAFFIHGLIPSKRILMTSKSMAIINSIFLVITLVTGPRIYFNLLIYYQILSLLLGIFLLFELFIAGKKGNQTASLSFMGFIPFFITAIIDVLSANFILIKYPTFFFPYGFALFIFIQSYVIARNFANAYETAEKLSKNLMKEVENRTIDLMKAKEQAEQSELKALLAKEKIAEQSEKIKEFDLQKTEFFQNISHEIRTPLTLMMAPIEDMLGEEKFSSEKRLEISLRNCKRLYSLINQLLDFQKLAAGKKKLNLKPLDMRKLLHECSEYFEPICYRKKIELKTEFTYESAFINTEIDAIEKVIFNYLSNALKHTPRNGSIKVDLKIRNDKVVFGVKDSGIGISPEDQNSIFSPFSQVGENNEIKAQGTGLGLALVKDLVSMMKGRVGVESEFNRGAYFWAEFPRSKAPKKKLPSMLLTADNKVKMNFVKIFSTYCNISDFEILNKFEDLIEKAEIFKPSCIIIVEDDEIELNQEKIGLIHTTFRDSFRILLSDKRNEKEFDEIKSAGLFHFCSKSDFNFDEVSNLINLYSNEDDKESLLSGNKANLMMVSEDNEDANLSHNSAPAIIEKDKTQDAILIVDDIEDMRTLLSDLLKKAGYNVLTARNGLEALYVLKEHTPILVLTDWVMPAMDGPQLIKKIKANPQTSTVPVILLTAKSDNHARSNAMQIGADSFLSKPFNEDELLSTLGNLLKLKESEKKVKELNQQITEQVLSRYLPKRLIEDALAGKLDFASKPDLKTVTVLFSDLSGFTSLTSRLGAETIGDLLNPYLAAMSEIVHEFGGITDKYMGDGIMVLFGAITNQAEEQQMMAALMAAQKMLIEYQESILKIDYNIGLRIGIASGKAVIGHFGSETRSDFTAIGPCVNLAARLESNANPMTILVSNKIKEKLLLDAGNLREIDAKGIGKIKSWEICL